MNCQRIQENFDDYQDGSLPAAATAELRAHLTTCAACQRAWSEWQQFIGQLDTLAATPEPSARLREQFSAMLEAHVNEVAPANPFAPARNRFERFFAALLPTRPSLQFAFSLALLCGGLFAGRLFTAKPVPPLPSENSAKSELAALRAQVNSMGQLVTYSLLQQHSTSERLHAVLATMELKNPDRKVLTDLVGTLVFDPSINVRLSAVDALAQHTDDALVRAGVLSALPRETAPLVQVAMIEFLADTGDPASRPVLEDLSRDPTADHGVRAAAHEALLCLTSSAHPFSNETSSSL